MSAAVVTFIVLGIVAGLGWGAVAGLVIALLVALRAQAGDEPTEKDPNEAERPAQPRHLRAAGGER